MKNRFSALMLSLGLSLGLAVPGFAAGTADLTAAEAASYLAALNRLEGVQYSGLEDLNGDGTPELIAARTVEDSNSMSQQLEVTVWTIRGGAAQQTMSQRLSANTGSAIGDVGIARGSGQARLYVGSSNPASNEASYSFYDLNGGAETYQGGMDLVGTAAVDSLYEELAQTWQMVPLFQGEGGYWYASDEVSASSDVSAALSERAKENSGVQTGSGTYTISGYANGTPFTATFQTTGVEKTTVTQVEYMDDADPVQHREEATVVTLRPDGRITIQGGLTGLLHPDAEEGISLDGRGLNAIIGFFDGNTFSSHANMIFCAVVDGPLTATFEADDFFSSSGARLLDVTDPDGDPIYIRVGQSTAAVGGFTDVKAGDYYADAVEWAVDKAITSGTSATTFSPDATCTRAQILTFLWRASGSPKSSGVNPFSDVSERDYYYQAALWAADQKLVSGASFDGDTPATRAATVTYLWKLAGQPSAGAASFTDVPAGADYAQAVGWAVREGITSGTGAATFSPNATCTRGQIVTFLYRDLAQ